ncbi:MAG: hypothetical protein FWG80_00190 [Alphaproteobacteria bacterium]|nr:hypothetical protein [Alphaproteobacteria bacterium]
MSLRVASPLAVTDEAIVSDISCHCEWSKTAKQSFPIFRVIASHKVAKQSFPTKGSIRIPSPGKIASSA